MCIYVYIYINKILLGFTYLLFAELVRDASESLPVWDSPFGEESEKKRSREKFAPEKHPYFEFLSEPVM